MPLYDTHMSQPFTGRLPGLTTVGPADLRYSSSTAPYYAAHIQESHGRQLAGLGSMRVADDASIPGYATNELDLLTEEDDVQGNGVFDPFSTQPNIYPDAGVFAARYGLPGYLARERMYQPSEVIDATTGRPVVYVNGGAVSMDSAAQIAFIERGMHQPPRPVIQAEQDAPMSYEGTAMTMQAPIPIPGTHADFAYAGLGQDAPPAPMSATTKLAIAGIIGALAGVAIAFGSRKK